MALDLPNLIDFYNGTALLEAGTQEWGYIDVGWHLAVPNSYETAAKELRDDWQDFHIGRSAFSDTKGGVLNKSHFLKANYHLINKTVNNPEIALFGAMLRMAIVEHGCFSYAMRARLVSVDEYSIVAPIGRDWDDIANDIPSLPNAKAIAQYVRRFHLTLISHLVFVFSARGHHYTNELNEQYRRLQEACFMQNAPGFNLPNNEHLYRNFVHCFGMAPLLSLSLKSVQEAQIPAAMTIRFTPHPPIAGVAHITTLKAIINAMEKEMLWKQVKDKFTDSLNYLDEMVNEIHAHPFDFHVSSRILTGRPRRMASEQSIKAFNELSQIALGYLEYLGNRNSLHKQKAVTAKAGGLGPAAETWEEAFAQYGKPDIKHMTAPEFIMEMFPVKENVNLKVSRVVDSMKLADRKATLEIEKAELEVQVQRQNLLRLGHE